MELFLFMAFLLVVWFVLAYILFLIPYGGFPLAIAIFGIVVAAAVFCFALTILGIARALSGKKIIFPLVSSLMARIEPFFKLLGFSQN